MQGDNFSQLADNILQLIGAYITFITEGQVEWIASKSLVTKVALVAQEDDKDDDLLDSAGLIRAKGYRQTFYSKKYSNPEALFRGEIEKLNRFFSNEPNKPIIVVIAKELDVGNKLLEIINQTAPLFAQDVISVQRNRKIGGGGGGGGSMLPLINVSSTCSLTSKTISFQQLRSIHEFSPLQCTQLFSQPPAAAAAGGNGGGLSSSLLLGKEKAESNGGGGGGVVGGGGGYLPPLTPQESEDKIVSARKRLENSNRWRTVPVTSSAVPPLLSSTLSTSSTHTWAPFRSAAALGGVGVSDYQLKIDLHFHSVTNHFGLYVFYTSDM